MRQEVEIRLQGEFDAELSKEDISHITKEILNHSPVRGEVTLKVKEVKEEAEIYGLNVPEFPNGFESWQETHFEISSQIGIIANSYEPHGKVKEVAESQGTGGLYELAKELADKFETLNHNREWDGEYFEEIEEFLEMELN